MFVPQEYPEVCDNTHTLLSNHRLFNLNPTLTEFSRPETPALLARAQAGDAEAFGELCLSFEGRLLRQAMALCGDPSVAEDLAQETLVEAWKCLARYHGRCQFFTWLCAILLNRYRSHLRQKRLLSFFGSTAPGRNETPALLEQPADPVARPDHEAQLHEQAELVRRCVGALPAKHQQVIHLRFFADDSLEGIAAALGCSVGTVKSRLFHALDKLRAMNDLRAHAAVVELKDASL